MSNYFSLTVNLECEVESNGLLRLNRVGYTNHYTYYCGEGYTPRNPDTTLYTCTKEQWLPSTPQCVPLSTQPTERGMCILLYLNERDTHTCMWGNNFYAVLENWKLSELSSNR